MSQLSYLHPEDRQLLDDLAEEVGKLERRPPPSVIDEKPEHVGIELLARFGALILDESRDSLGDLDGGFVQDTAERLGLLHYVDVAAPCSPNYCNCAEYGEFPQQCLRYTDETKALVVALSSRPGVESEKAAPKAGET